MTMDYDRRLESGRFGVWVRRTGYGYFAIAGAFLAAAVVLGGWWWLLTGDTALGLYGGWYLTFRLGPRAIEDARQHHEFMEAHRAAMRALDARWN